ncbi:MAG: redoxin domain-containing protein [Methylococcaceae bacterium]|nr:redoxin domain-containing protein [Methylococcaceae bacterium]
MLNSKIRSLIVLLFALIGSAPIAAEALRPFKSDSLQTITAERAGKPFILMFWSLDCASCMKELDALAGTLNKYSNLDIVMVSTDEESYAKDVEAMLSKHGLQRVESWIFGDANAQRLRYQIDPSWFGELPRSYFYDASHHRLPHSGVLTIDYIEAWLSALNPHP